MDNSDPSLLRLSDIPELAYLSFHDNVSSVTAVRIDAAEDIHQGGLTRAIFANQRLDFAATDLEGNLVQGLDTRKLLCDVAHFKDIFFHSFDSFNGYIL